MRVATRAIDAVDPGRAVLRSLHIHGSHLEICNGSIDLSRIGAIRIVGAGKASVSMARALERVLGDRLTGGLVCTAAGYGSAMHGIELIEAGHPIPDRNSLAGAQKTLEVANVSRAVDGVFCLLSGGASALWCLPAEGVTLDDMIVTTAVLLRCGADIHEVNTVRKHLSGIKGGFLARAAHPARLVTLMISDVVGDRVESIGSGPTVPDSTTFRGALDVVARYDIETELPGAVMRRLRAGAGGEVPETPKPGDAVFNGTIECIVASNAEALSAAADEARLIGYDAYLVDAQVQGEARDAGRRIIGTVRDLLARGTVHPPAMILSGGETTVKVRGGGTGGRNQELVLASAIEIAGADDMVIASVGTDGTDGPTDAAGAFADGTTLRRGEAMALEARASLDDNDSYTYFDRLGDLIRTGPTGTNAMDIQIVAIAR
jgi:glycerate 2-kinase